MNRLSRHALAASSLALLLAAPAAAQLPDPCGELANSYGPFDYRTERGEPKYLVEGAHFTPIVEQLIRGRRGYLGGDIDYTLRAFPNHHRALISTIRYGERLNTDQPPNMGYSVECYLKRAVRFQPDDVVARMLYADYLFKKKRPEDAQAQLQAVDHLAGSNPFTLHSIGTVYLDAKQPEKALVYAHRALALGFENSPLQQALQKAGAWREPMPEPGDVGEPDEPPSPAAAAAPAPAASGTGS